MNPTSTDLPNQGIPMDRGLGNQPPPNRRVLQPPLKFSPEEKRVLNECNSESFYQRSLPLASMMGFGTYLGVQSGYLKRNSRFGPAPKVMAALCVGYFMGKVSYQKRCAEKLMELPNSTIGQILRQRRDGEIGPVSPGFGNPISMFGASSPDVYSDAGPSSSLDLDTDRPNFSNSNLDDTYRPVPDASLTIDGSALPPRTPGISYDTLREKNRNEHTTARSQPYKLEEPIPPIMRPRPPQPEAKNKYGDTMD